MPAAHPAATAARAWRTRAGQRSALAITVAPVAGGLAFTVAAVAASFALAAAPAVVFFVALVATLAAAAFGLALVEFPPLARREDLLEFPLLAGEQIVELALMLDVQIAQLARLGGGQLELPGETHRVIVQRQGAPGLVPVPFALAGLLSIAIAFAVPVPFATSLAAILALPVAVAAAVAFAFFVFIVCGHHGDQGAGEQSDDQEPVPKLHRQSFQQECVDGPSPPGIIRPVARVSQEV